MLDLRERGIDLRVLNMDIGTSTTAGKLMFRIVSALAESERDLISERTRSALDAKRRRGELIGGRTPAHTAAQVQRATNLVAPTGTTGQAIAGAVGVTRTRLFVVAARRRAEPAEGPRAGGSWS